MNMGTVQHILKSARALHDACVERNLNPHDVQVYLVEGRFKCVPDVWQQAEMVGAHVGDEAEPFTIC